VAICLLFWSCHTARVLAVEDSNNDDSISQLVDLLGDSDDASFHLDILKGINDALKGRRKVEMPKTWPAVYKKLKESKDAQVRELSQSLAIVFGDSSAFDAHKRTLMDAKAEPDARKRSLESLLGAKAADLAPLLHQLLADKAVRGEAIKALAAYDDAKTPDVLIAAYKHLSQGEKQAAVNTLAARAAYAQRLLAAIKDGAIPRGDVPADTVRQLRLIKDEKLQSAITDLWGKVNDTPADKQKKIIELRDLLSKQTGYEPDLARGRAIFAQTCQQCHTLFGVGGRVGPDITGSNRNNLDYLLQNVVDPNALIGKDFQATEVRTEEDQIIVGIIEREDDAALTLKTTGGSVVIPKNEISSRRLSESSMMPQGLIDQLKESELRDFVAYMASPGQSPLLATANNAIGLFNGQDLSTWLGDSKHWSVEKGEIVGKSSGLKEYKYLVSQMVVTDFHLKMKVKLAGDAGNSGIFFRCRPLEDGTVAGPQADIGPGWWGKLVDAGPGSRGTLWEKSGEAHVKKGEWNSYEVRAVGSKVKTWINGQLCVNLDDAKLPARGHLALQLHIGEAMEIRVKDVELEVIEK
jgi:putative heme-binding domain-containing protein